ncbi:uncharacterized protein LOC143182245 [Calliopsis andreniformis]|uniref:uncharacterized protein LOC143182245 n=1 Tax=Calliopsis andreniformis TaxID=337506 RepID=UPI003FCEE5E3
MDNSGAVTIEGENYEVVDECVEEEDTSNIIQNKSAEKLMDSEKEEKEEKAENEEKEEKEENEEKEEKDVKQEKEEKEEKGEKEEKEEKKDEEPMDVVPLDSDKQNENVQQAEDGPQHVDLANDVPLDNSENLTDVQSTVPSVENECPQKSSTDTIDFTADITLDQLDEQKDMTDEDVLHHLDEIENIVLDSSDFQIPNGNDQTEEKDNTKTNVEEDKCEQKNESNESTTVEQTVSCDDVVVKQETETTEKYEWYEKKLAEKQAIVKERLLKVARVLGISYPCYEKWLEWEEKVRGNPLCRMKPARRCRLDKPYTNRWKFICNKKRVDVLEKNVDGVDTSVVKKTQTVWKLEATGACGINIKDESEFPPFVLRAVKIFEDFLQTTEQPQECTNENFSDDISIEVESKKDTTEAKQEWLWLLVRCNSMDELMLFATGRNISRATMERLKQVYESGPGKDCNVKSLYCKSMNKHDDTIVTNTTFLVGSEALDEVVGGLKVQLAPKTNFWSNTAGAENVAHAVMDLLAPNSKTVVLEIGCGIGLIGLMIASKCQQVIGVDSPSEVEEAEMTCELNNIKNASFIMGSPTEVTSKIVAAVKNRKTSAIINANTNIGRALEVIMCLRKILSLKRIVMITMLTKQSVRAILELARPGDHSHGLPFIPTFALVVDTLPVGPHFEAVILLQRRAMNKLDPAQFQKPLERKTKAPDAKTSPEKMEEQTVTDTDKKPMVKGPELWTKKNFNKTTPKQPAKKFKVPMKKPIYPKGAENVLIKNKFKGKRSHSPDKGEVPPKKIVKKFGKFGAKPWVADPAMKKKKEWGAENLQLRINPLYDKKTREHKDQADLRERLSNNRVDTDIAQTVKEHQAMLEIAKEKLSGPAPTVDVNTAKQLQSMLNMVLEQTNKLQSQLPRSVWDRIAPPENANLEQREMKQEEPPLKGRYVQEMGTQDIVITTPNKNFLENEETKPFYKKYNNLAPLEPNIVVPVTYPIEQRKENSFRPTPERYHEMDVRQQVQDNSWNRDKSFERNRWNEMGNMRRQVSPPRHRMSPPKRLSPKRPLLSPPRRPCSPPRRHFSPLRRPSSPMYRQRSPLRRQMSPPRRPMSPPRRISPTRRPMSPRRLVSSPRRTEVTMNRPMSPMRRQMSPPRRQMSPIRPAISPPRRQMSPMGRQMSPQRRQIPSPNRMMSNRQEMLLSRRQAMPQERQQMSPVRRGGGSPQRFMFGRLASPPRRQQSPQRRQMSPPQRFGDEWDIPSRRAVEQNTWTRPADRLPEQNLWRNDKPSTSNNNWDQTSCNDRPRKPFNQEKWDNKEPVRNETWCSGANNWSPKQAPVKPMMNKETWSSSSDNRWTSTPNMPGSSSNDNWNIRGKDSFSARSEGWMDNKKQGRWETLNVKETWKQGDKEDVNDLPEDARDPWGDESNLGLKERWLKFESINTSSTWQRENEQQGDTWSKPKDNWQNKGSMSFNTKPQWQNNGIQNVGDSRWLSQSNIEKKTMSNTWQSGKNMGSWQSQNTNFQSQRPFSTTQYKGFN